SLETNLATTDIDEESRIIKIGQAEIKEKRGASQENPDSGGSQALKLLHKLVPEFTKTHPSTRTFTNITKIDIKSCYANIMRDYPLPCGSEERLTDPQIIEQKIKEEQEGFVRFYLRQTATIKKQQIPFLPDYHNEIKANLRGCFILYSKLFRAFQKHYKIRGKIVYTDFWMFAKKKGCVNPYLDYCQELKLQDEKKGKKLANVLYGVLGRNQRIGYVYHPFHLAVNHLAILQTYYLYRQFKPEQVLAIRSDCIYVRGELPDKLLIERKKYHISQFQKITLANQDTLFIHDTQ
ncbi:517_t:CDS:2, partial [Cetraspora pellucida]